MIIYPAIDIKDGSCVRLLQGKFDELSIYSEDPVEMALKWEKKGATYLHMVDLDGAKTGNAKNLNIAVETASRLKIPIQLGGGIRTIETIDYILTKGIQRVILGTTAVGDNELVKTAIKRYGNKIVIGIDAKDGLVAIKGWVETSKHTAIEFGKRMEDMGVETIIYTDISRDGMLVGPNLNAMEAMARALKIEVIASGGVGRLEDIEMLKSTGVTGVIIGKALYTGNITLESALKIAEV
jgi:phosphoribosylformimino-5-aminoimidazole carboxamide ribotide isomerase